jgi:hypothetical protein
MEFVPSDFEEEQQRVAEEALAAVASSVPLPNERISAVVTTGAVYVEVLKEAESTATDLV